eukprot:2028933-Prymnesium_polylepis.1
MPRPAQSAWPTCEVDTRAVRVGPEPRSRLSTSAAPRRRAARALLASPEARPSLQAGQTGHPLQPGRRDSELTPPPRPGAPGQIPDPDNHQ